MLSTGQIPFWVFVEQHSGKTSNFIGYKSTFGLAVRPAFFLIGQMQPNP